MAKVSAGMPFETDLSTMSEWLATAEGVRRACLDWGVMAAKPQIDHPAIATQAEVELIGDMCREAVMAGRLIDFGMWPQAFMQHCGGRGGILFNQGAFPQPFADPWIFMHRWEPQGKAVTCAYLVAPVGDIDCEIVELCPIRLVNRECLSIGDRGLLEAPAEGKDINKYYIRIAPSAFRLMLIEDGQADADDLRGVGSNLCDPMVTALMLLNTRGVERETVAAPAKLNRVRARGGKPALGGYTRVASDEYVTVIMAQRERRSHTDGGGHHASPIAHLRRGHFRHYESGGRSFIRDTLVNVTEAARSQFKSARTHYSARM